MLELSLLYLSFQSFDSQVSRCKAGIPVNLTVLQVLKSIMEAVANLASYEKKASLVRILPFQHLVWVIDAGASE